ncbi:glycosyltransferase family 4 protein [Effusibacillus consociatus]|uniref:Glycosyltransferase family 4 protein n=1 Tax=Effusibacillus consociatus TaxID=1117041 RepID=A0ABV9PVZ8_9BACL
MKILLVTYWYLPHVGGVNTYIEMLKKEFEEHGHQVDVLAHYPDMKNIYLVNTGKIIDKSPVKDIVYDEVYRYYHNNLSHVDPWIRWREIERYTFELMATLFNLDQYDLIHSQDIVSTRALWRVKPNHVPLVATIHGILATEHLNSGQIASKDSFPWKYAEEEEFYGHISSDQTIVSTKWQKEELSSKFRIPKDKLNVIRYGIELSSFLVQMNREPSPPVQKDPNQLVIACPARLVPEKGHQTLIEALSILKEKRDDFVCWLIGDGLLRKELETYCEQKGITHKIIFMGNRTDVPALLNKADIMVLPSLQEMHSFAIMEAAIAGLPIVASNVGGIPEMIEHGKTGLIFEKEHSTQLADRLFEVMSNEKIRNQLGKDAKAWGMKEFTSKAVYERTMAVYNQALQTSTSVSRSTVEAPDLDGQYGLTNSGGIQRYYPESIFKFDVMRQFDPDVWDSVVNSLPLDYSIPDTSFVQTLIKKP